MDTGTILLLAAILAIAADIIVLLIGPRLENYDTISAAMAGIGFLASMGALIWLGILIFGNQFQYEYVFLTTKSTAPWYLKLSSLWAGQAGSLVFWAATSFVLYTGYRVLTREYEEDTIVYRGSILIALQTMLITINALASDPFRANPNIVVEGAGLNPLLRTIWNVIHPPIVFIAYALAVIPFAVKLAGFTVRSEERNSEPIPILESFNRFMTVASWLMLTLGIAIGAYWAYVVLGWGGYWAWDPVETTSLVPWLLLTAYYHAKAVLKDHDVLRDSFLVFTYVTVLYATWVTRSGVLNSVHGFSISIVSWTMFYTVVANFILAAVLTIRAGYVDMDDEDDGGGFRLFSLSNIRDLSIKLALFGILAITAISVIGVVLPAGINLPLALADPVNYRDSMVSVSLEFFRAGFYVGSLFLVVSAFYCMRSTIISRKTKSVTILILLLVGVGLSILTASQGYFLPTNYWPANALIPVAIGGVIFLAVAFGRTLAGRESGSITMRRMGRLMLHLGLITLLLGVFMSENVVYETNLTYLETQSHEVSPGIQIVVVEIDLGHWVHETDFELTVFLQVIENNQSAWLGVAIITGHPGWGSVTHDVYLQSTALRDVFVAITGFSQVGPGVMQVTLHTKVLPLVSLVWVGVVMMFMALFPLAFIEGAALRRALKEKEQDLYEFENETPHEDEANPPEA